ncbi:unnamed protein product [Ilex paraguariensis]|uniref:RING-type E3 ubiquitin transferase n=1 Tax=Ilex paraguariensis TaxID=185542 RepID=A0ABC8UKQ2_9AQUA
MTAPQNSPLTMYPLHSSMGDRSNRILGLSPLTVALIGVASATTLLLIYHCVVSRWCNPRAPVPSLRHQQLAVSNAEGTPTISIEISSLTELIPSHKYNKDIALVSKTAEDGTCAVCLCEFQDGEPVRVLPECLHPFHAPCIDMWLFSHSNCPLCRAATTPSRQSLGHRLESEAFRLEIHQP